MSRTKQPTKPELWARLQGALNLLEVYQYLLCEMDMSGWAHNHQGYLDLKGFGRSPYWLTSDPVVTNGTGNTVGSTIWTAEGFVATGSDGEFRRVTLWWDVPAGADPSRWILRAETAPTFEMGEAFDDPFSVDF